MTNEEIKALQAKVGEFKARYMKEHGRDYDTISGFYNLGYGRACLELQWYLESLRTDLTHSEKLKCDLMNQMLDERKKPDDHRALAAASESGSEQVRGLYPDE